MEDSKPTEYRVDLDVYNGPLDLLLYLIKRDELDIYDIPIAHITEQYCKYVDLLKQIDLTLAGEFMVLAASLIELKARMLLPRPVLEGDDGEALDPRLELVRQLLEYKQFKDVARELGQSAQLAASRYPPALRKDDLQLDEAQRELDLRDVAVWDLLEAFDKLMAATLAGKYQHEVIYDDAPIELYEADIIDRLRTEGSLSFSDIFRGRVTKGEIIGLFLALLELIRQELIRAEQSKATEEIYIFPITTGQAESTQANDPDNSH
ncbi:MAG: segregation/condensation protein A [Phycisphaerae bacterium]|nr:segregation/condensation protein A [Phycisphaerae bacterium]